jgi:hypothetical protein
MDSLGMGLGAARDELATLQLTELHPLPQTMERQGERIGKHQVRLAALRDFDAAFDRFGSSAPDLALWRPPSARTWSAARPAPRRIGALEDAAGVV